MSLFFWFVRPESVHDLSISLSIVVEIRKNQWKSMAGRLTNAASRILGGNGVVCRSVASSLRLRSGMGLPTGKHIVPDKPVSILHSSVLIKTRS